MSLRKKLKQCILITSLTIFSLTPFSSVQAATANTVNTREVKYGAFMSDRPTTKNINAFEQLQQKHLDVVNMFIDWNTSFSSIESCFDDVYANDSIMSLTWEAWGLSNTDIANGKKDDYIKQMAQSMKDFNKPIIVRLFHEANGNWYDWGLGDSEVNTNETYIAAFRHVVDIFRETGADKVQWDFNVSASNVGTGSSFLGHYPGDDYVDIISIDGYNWGTTQSWGSHWQSFDEIFSLAYKTLAVKNKPMAISEFASAEIGGDKAEWYTDAFTKINSDEYSLLNTIVTFSIDKETDWRINSSEDALKAYIAGIHISNSSTNTGDESKEPEQPVNTGSLKVQEFNSTLSETSNTISTKLKVTNTSNTAIKLSDIKLNYYYNADDEKAQNFTCDWCSAGTNNVVGTFVNKSKANSSLELTFNNETASIQPGENIEIAFRINKSDWTNYNQSNDYSFNSKATSYVDWNKTPAYVSNKLVWGVEP